MTDFRNTAIIKKIFYGKLVLKLLEKYITLNKIDDVKRFVSACMSKDYDIDLVSGKYIVDAKSIMAIFSLDLSKPICMHAECDDEAEFLAEIKDFISE